MRRERRGRRWRIIVSLTVLLCAFIVREVAASDDPRIARIRGWYLAAEKSLSRSRVVRRDLAEFSSQGGALTAYFSGDTLTKLDANFYVERGRVTDDVWLRDDSVYFVSHIVGKYDRSMDGRISHRVQYRLYVAHDTLIRWIDTTGEQLPLQNPAAGAEATRALGLARVLMRCATSEGPAEACLAPSKDSL